MSKKSDYILESIIKAYLSEQNPIGSMLLQECLDMPASTIRVYFKQLDSDGLICKLHASGGRIPTLKAMKHYWAHYFSELNDYEIDIKNHYELLNLAQENELFCLVIDKKDEFLHSIVQIDEKYLILEFSNFAVLLPYERMRKQLFDELVGCDLKDLKNVLYRLNLGLELEAIERALSEKIHCISGEKILTNIVKTSKCKELLGASLLDFFSSNLLYDELFLPEFMGVKIDCKFEAKPCEMVLAGSIFTDYEILLNQFKEAM